LIGSILILILLVFLYIYNGFQQALLHSINTLNHDFIQQVNSTAASAESVLQSLTAQIFNISSVRKLRSNEVLTNTEMIEGIRILNDFTASSLIVDSIYVYNGKQDYVYSTLSRGAFSDKAASFLDRDAVEIMTNRKASKRLMPIRRLSEAYSSSANRDMISLMVFDVFADGSLGDNVLMMNISSAWFSELYFGRNPQDLSFILDEKQEVISCCGNQSPLDEPRLMKELNSRIQKDDSQGNFFWESDSHVRYLCFYTQVDNKPWHYIRVVPYSRHLTGLMQIQSSTYFFLIVGFLLIITAFIFVALRIWFPFHYIRNALSNIEAKSGPGNPVEQLNYLINRSDNAHRIITALKHTLHNAVLTSILLGQETKEDNLTDEFDLAVRRGEPTYLIFISSARVEAMLNIMRANCPECEGILMPGEHTVLLVQPRDERLMLKTCEEILYRHSNCRIIISQPTRNWHQLPGCYTQALERYKLRFLHAEKRLFDLRNMPELDDDSTRVDMTVEGITSALRSGDLEIANSLYEDYFRMMGNKTYRVVEISMNSLASAVLKLYYEVFPDAIPPYGEAKTAFICRMEDINTEEDVSGFFRERFSHIVEKIQLDRQNRQRQLLDEITRQIQTRYTEDDLCLANIADTMQMSSAYIGRIFRQVHGISVSEFINQLRMEEAKRLLLETDLLVKEICPMIGIENTKYFFVLFKRAFGMTPKQFRTQAGMKP